ncbi:ATP-binding cassette domain-containing protein [Sphingomonas sp. M1-B02]|uniref:ATP-binding cassette domain-containing protein n=1 Tax=Sphingomonas sp. M1-B02 TaxID=3114300 RepID=UPI00223FA09D|nr:ATP-binding cassette domain-containing protein [Sphingomonas sp. S6-11]UZK67714.1 ATP-binding cassette domain-containing protein [Sphingomonas sp. S6-11]
MAVVKEANVLRNAFGGVRSITFFAVILSIFYGLLKLAGPLFMILVFDRILPSRSEATLAVLLILLLIVLGAMTLLDYSRRRILARIGAQFQERIEDYIFNATARDAYAARVGSKPAAGLNEADQLRGFFHSGSLVVILDFFWSPVFLAVLFIIDPLVGWVVVVGLALLVVINFWRMSFTKAREELRIRSADKVGELKDTLQVSRHVIESQQMTAAYNTQWMVARRRSRDTAVEIKDGTAWFSTLSSHTTLLIQYTALAAAAYLTIKGELTVGAMVASMYLARHVFNPAERFLRQVPSIREARENWRRLDKILSVVRTPTATAEVPAALRLFQVAARCPITRDQLLRNITFEVSPGSAVEIVGGGGSGKTVLAEVLIGRFPRSGGKVLLGNVAIERLSITDAARTIGYVPQRVDFLGGTIEENIVGLDPEPDGDRLVRATRLAQVHDKIVSLPEGYLTRIDAVGSIFSKSERHRLALARALYPDPYLLIIDEPDATFRDALSKGLKRDMAEFFTRGGILIVLTRLALKRYDANLRFVLDNGTLRKPEDVHVTDLKVVSI